MRRMTFVVASLIFAFTLSPTMIVHVGVAFAESTASESSQKPLDEAPKGNTELDRISNVRAP